MLANIYLNFLISPDFILEKYSRISNFTSFDKISNPKIFGNAIAKIIISEKSITAPKLTEEPIIIKIKKINLYVISDFLEFQRRLHLSTKRELGTWVLARTVPNAFLFSGRNVFAEDNTRCFGPIPVPAIRLAQCQTR